jgi:hypothetical protein
MKSQRRGVPAKTKIFLKEKKGKYIPVTGRGGPSAHSWRRGCQHYAQAALHPWKIPGTHFLEAQSIPGS